MAEHIYLGRAQGRKGKIQEFLYRITTYITHARQTQGQSFPHL